MGGHRRGSLAGIALLALAVVALAPAFLAPSSRSGSHLPPFRVAHGASGAGRAEAGVESNGTKVSAISALSLLLATAVLGRPGTRLRRISEVSAPASTVALLPAAATSSPALLVGQGAAPTLLPAAAARGHSRVAVKSIKSCYKLYFRRPWPYEKRHQKNLNRRAYNIYHTNRYKKLYSRVLRNVRRVMDGTVDNDKFKSMADLMAYFKHQLDHCFLVIDEVAIQGVLGGKEAVEKKEAMCRALVICSYKLGFLEEKPDRFQAQYKVLGYEPPKCKMLREPRPWQLPGWKSPWMLRREYLRWVAQKEAKEKEAAEAAAAAAQEA